MGMDSDLRGVTPQPPPKSGKRSQSVTDFLVGRLKEWDNLSSDVSTSAQTVIEDVLARREAGKEKYGRELESFNGRDAYIDAYQEAIDLAMYLSQLVLEGHEEFAAQRDILCSLVLYLRGQIEERNPR